MFNLQQEFLGQCPSIGKAMPLNTLVKTPKGWTRLGDLIIGDLVIGPLGNHSPIVGITPQGITENFRFVFEDGRTADSHPLHLWEVSETPITEDGSISRAGYVTTTQDVMNHFDQFSYHIPLVQEVHGMLRLPDDASNIIELAKVLLTSGIPIDHTVMELSYSERYAIVKSMLEQSGCHVCDRGVAFLSEQEMGALNFQKLLWSIGGIATLCPYGSLYRVCFKHRDVVGLVDSLIGSSLAEILDLEQYVDLKLKIVGIQQQKAIETLCVTIDSDDNLYIVDDWVVTR